MPFFTFYVSAFCGECDWGERAEDPTPAEQARVIRHANAHRAKTGHNVAIERGQAWGPRQ